MGKEYGIRVFFMDGKWEDYDPISPEDYKTQDGKLSIWNDTYVYPMDQIEAIAEYELTQDQVDGMYVRYFDTDESVRYTSDKVKS